MKPIAIFLRRYSQREDGNRLEHLLSTMRKETTTKTTKPRAAYIETKQKHQLRIKEESKFHSPDTVNLQVLGSGARGACASIYLFSEQNKYLFNCGEGAQRLAQEHGTKLSGMEHIFLTRNTWNRYGGVPGMCLTLQNIGMPALYLHGPPGINEIIQSTELFVMLKNMKVLDPKCEAGEYFEDSVLRVNYVPLYKNGSKANEKVTQSDEITREPEAKVPESAFENKSGDKIKSDTLNETTNKPKNKEADKNLSSLIMAYICKLRALSGPLDSELCSNEVVRSDPLHGLSEYSCDVKLSDDSSVTVTVENVCKTTSPGPVFVFIDIPDESYLPSLINCETFKSYQQEVIKENDNALIVIHFSSEEMMENATYKEWMDRFPENTKHWFVNERNEFTGSFASHQIQRQLNKLDENVFPLLKEPNPNLCDGVKIDSEARKDEEPVVDKFGLYPELRVLSTFHVRPAKGFDRSLEPFSNLEKVAQETLVSSEYCDLLQKFKAEAKKLVDCRTKEQRAAEYPKIVTLGTGSGIASETRNVSANLVSISKDHCAILDCGEGTLGQLIRFYGRDGADEVLKNLRLIYVSHPHPDHHLGLISILARRRKVTSDKVVLIAPSTIRAWLTFYNFRVEEIFSTFDMSSCADFLECNKNYSLRESVYAHVGLVNIKTCLVQHCPHSYGIAFEMKNLMKSKRYPNETIKITYSGDTLPCDDLVCIGQNSDVLIHEATMEDDLVKDACIKMHSTVSQAIDIGRRMNAKFVILTHFSRLYPKIPRMKESVENVAIGFDYMEVTLNDLPMMHLMYKPLKAIFRYEFECMEQRALKREYAQERKRKFNLPNANQPNNEYFILR